ncbi:hypothetical protein MMC09_005551 [Bachmanniomyces sp. S44760]|nr:hypothetical protein [Bachmanniomyces sp. S44760]
MSGYTVRQSTPDINTYIYIRKECLSPKSIEAATIGLKNSLFSVEIHADDAGTVGMGRVVGDGGCFFQVVDIAVLPSHRRKGLSRLIMAAIKEWLDKNAPDTAYVSLLADGTAYKLYSQYGFVLTGDASVGMVLRR